MLTTYEEIARRRIELFSQFEDQDNEWDGNGFGTPTQIELPEEQQVRLHVGADSDIALNYGVTYQKCGGGRRVIRRGNSGA